MAFLKKGEEAKSHKYYERIPKKPFGYRYFYTKQEYESYLKGNNSINNKTTNVTPKVVKNLASSTSSLLKVYSNKKLSDLTKNSSVVSKGKSKVTDILNNVKNFANTAVSSLKNYANKVKQGAEKVVDNIMNTPILSDMSLYFDQGQKQTRVFTLKDGWHWITEYDHSKDNKDNRHFNDYLKKLFEENKKKIKEKIEDKISHFNNKLKELESKPQLTSLDQMNKINGEHSTIDDLSVVNPFHDDISNGKRIERYSKNCPSCTLAFELRRRGYDVQAGDDLDGASSFDIGKLYDDYADETEDIIFMANGLYAPNSKRNLIEDKSKIVSTKDGNVIAFYNLSDFTDNLKFNYLTGAHPEGVLAYVQDPKTYTINVPIIDKNEGFLGLTKGQTHEEQVEVQLFGPMDAKQISEDMLKAFPEGARGVFEMSWIGGSGHICNWVIEDGKVVLYDAQVNKRLEDIADYVDRALDFQVFRTDNVSINMDVIANNPDVANVKNALVDINSFRSETDIEELLKQLNMKW